MVIYNQLLSRGKKHAHTYANCNINGDLLGTDDNLKRMKSFQDTGLKPNVTGHLQSAILHCRPRHPDCHAVWNSVDDNDYSVDETHGNTAHLHCSNSPAAGAARSPGVSHPLWTCVAVAVRHIASMTTYSIDTASALLRQPSQTIVLYAVELADSVTDSIVNDGTDCRPIRADPLRPPSSNE